MKLLRILSALLVFALALAAQREQPPKPTPPFPGDGNPQHNGQPMHCQNHDHNGWLHNCDCRAEEADHCNPGDPEPSAPTGRESSKCKVYCRKDHCHCVTPCGG